MMVSSARNQAFLRLSYLHPLARISRNHFIRTRGASHHDRPRATPQMTAYQKERFVVSLAWVSESNRLGCDSAYAG